MKPANKMFRDQSIHSIKMLLMVLTVMMLVSCTATKPWYSKNADRYEHHKPEKEPNYRLILMGDQGEPQLDSKDPVLEMLTRTANQVQNGDVVFLGDNIYRFGMETEPPEAKALAERKISKTLTALHGFGGDVFFIAGNHDWWLGYENLLAQEKFLDEYTGLKNIHFSPKAGCPGPEVVALNDNILLVMLDSEWMFQTGNDSIAQNRDCPNPNWQSAMDELRTIAETNIDKFLILAVHHPLYSQGRHGGHFTLKSHLFPLTEINKNLWIPLPIVGSLYPLLRNMGVSNQDLSGSLNRTYRMAIQKAVSCHPNVVIASGHDHNLQYFYQDGLHQIVSGSGSKNSPVKKGGKAQFVSGTKGFATIDVYENEKTILSFWHINDTINPVFKTRLDDPDKPLSAFAQTSDISSFPDSISAITDSIYDIGKTGRFFWGQHHRRAWSSPHNYKTLKLRQVHGGLNIYRAGGGFQTTTLFVKDPQDKRYVIRTMRKDPSEILPKEFRKTFASFIIQDQISASHPFGASLVPPIASAAGIYYNQPEYYYMPDDPALGQYRERARNQPVTLEEFISINYLKENFGDKATAILSTEKLMDQLLADPAHQVDLHWYWRTKLVDMLLNDWDRHEGQYFWVSMANNGITEYRPFPIDRDNVMFKMDGLIPSMVNKKWNMPQFQHFDYDIAIIEGMNFQSMHMDRRILTGLSREEWIIVAADLQQRITDSVIGQAVEQLPQSDSPEEKEMTIAKLKSRRDKLVEFAERYYEVFAQQLEITGTKQNDVFIIEKSSNGSLELSIYSDSNAEIPYFKRTISPDETKEVRLYGIEGDDRVVFKNQGEKLKIKFHIIPGSGDMQLTYADGDKVPSNIRVHNNAVKNIDAAVRKENMGAFTRTALQNHGYNYMEYAFGYTAPAFSFGYSSDDGIYLGGGVIWKKPGFRKYPFAAVHKIIANVAPANGSFNVFYESDFTGAIAGHDLLINANIYAPNNSSKFFGFGNDSASVEPSRYYNVRRDIFQLSVLLKMNINHRSDIWFGPTFEATNVRQIDDRFYTSESSGLTASDLKSFTLPGLQFRYLFNSTNQSIYPTQGLKIKFATEWSHNIQDNASLLRSNLSFSIYQKIPQTGFTVASRIGGLFNLGKYRFFQANTLGGAGIFYSASKDLFDRATFRGATRDRFAGRRVFYHNTELRLKVRDVRSKVIPGEFGLQLFFDYGKVWIDNSSLEPWHTAVGGGFWYNFYGRFLVSVSYGQSKNDKSFNVLTGFLF